MKVEVMRYRKPDGYVSRFWSVTVDGELLAVTVYRKGAKAVAEALTNVPQHSHAPILEDSAETVTDHCNLAGGLTPRIAR